MKQCTCYALRAIDCTCKPAKYGELYTSPTAKQEQGEPLIWSTTQGGAYVCGEYHVVQRIDDKGWNAHKEHEHLLLGASLEDCKSICERDAVESLTKQEQGEDLAFKADYWKRMHDEVRAELIKTTSSKQEPVGWIDSKGNMICTKINESCKPLYTTPQQRSWVGLTRDEIQDLLDIVDHYNYPQDLIVYTQAKLKEKNT